jgi:hypothetical protein
MHPFSIDKRFDLVQTNVGCVQRHGEMTAVGDALANDVDNRAAKLADLRISEFNQRRHTNKQRVAGWQSPETRAPP